MTRPASYFVAAQERYCLAAERALEATTEALEHTRKCASCRVLGHKCPKADTIDKKIVTAMKVMETELNSVTDYNETNRRVFNFLQHVAEDKSSPYHDYACKVLNEVEEAPYGKRAGRKSAPRKVGK